MKIKIDKLLVIVIILFQTLSFGQFQKKELQSPYIFNSQKVNFNISEYYDVTNSLPINFNKKGIVDYTSYIQKALNENKKVILPNFDVAVTGIYPNSENEILFNENSRLILIPNDKERYEIIGLHNVKNVKIINPNIVGDRKSHLGNSGEWGFGIDIRKSENIEIYNARIYNCWGDGIMISNSDKFLKKQLIDFNINLKNIIIDNVLIENSRRNGIGIVSGENITIKNIIINNTYGTSPMSSIDIEPSSDKFILNNININNIKVFNAYSGIQINLNQYLSNSNKTVNINIKNVTVSDANSGILVSGFKINPKKKRLNGIINISNINFLNVSRPFVKGYQYNSYPLIYLKDYKIIMKNKEIINNSEYIYKNVKERNGLNIL